MARPDTNLTENEFKYFEDNGMEEDISSISRRIGKRLTHREQKWTTLGAELQGQKPCTSQVEDDQKTKVHKAGAESHQKYTETTADQRGAHGMVSTTPPIKLVLLGPEGAGKSALGNLLVGRQVFKMAATSESGLHGCRKELVREEDQQWEVVDTPGKPFTEGSTSKSSKMKFWSSKMGNSSDSLKEIEDQVKQADVIIFVLNTSHKRTPDMGINAFKQIFPHNLSETCMLVTTHGDTHYKTKGTAELVDDIKESLEICEFLHRINERVVIVELGDGQQSEDAILDGNAVYGKEKDQARQMVMTMVKRIMQKRHTLPRTSMHSDNKGREGMTPKFV